MHLKVFLFWILSLISLTFAEVTWDEGEWIPIEGPCKSCQKARLLRQKTNFKLESKAELAPKKRDASTFSVSNNDKFSVRPGRLLNFKENVDFKSIKSEPTKVQLVYLPEGSIEDLRSARLARVHPNNVNDLQLRPTRNAVSAAQHFGQGHQSFQGNGFFPSSHSGNPFEPARPAALVAQKGREREARQQIRLLEAALSSQNHSPNAGDLPRVFIAPTHIPPPPGYIKIPLIPNKNTVSVQEAAPGTFLTADVRNETPPGFIQLLLPEHIAHLSREIPFVIPDRFNQAIPESVTESAFVTEGADFNLGHLSDQVEGHRFSHANTNNEQNFDGRIHENFELTPTFNEQHIKPSRLPNLPIPQIASGFNNNNFGHNIRIPINNFNTVPFNQGKSFNSAPPENFIRQHPSRPVSSISEDTNRRFPEPEIVTNPPRERIIVNQANRLNNNRIRPRPNNIEFLAITNPPIRQNTFAETTFPEIDFQPSTQPSFDVENTIPPTPRPFDEVRSVQDNIKIGQPVIPSDVFNNNDREFSNAKKLAKRPVKSFKQRRRPNNHFRGTTAEFTTTPASTFDNHRFGSNSVQEIHKTEDEFDSFATTIDFQFPTTISPNIPSPVKISQIINDSKVLIKEKHVRPQIKNKPVPQSLNTNLTPRQTISVGDTVVPELTAKAPKRVISKKPKNNSRRQRVRVKGRRRRPHSRTRRPITTTASAIEITTNQPNRSPNDTPSTLLPPFSVAKTLGTRDKANAVGTRRPSPLLRNEFGSRVREQIPRKAPENEKDTNKKATVTDKKRPNKGKRIRVQRRRRPNGVVRRRVSSGAIVRRVPRTRQRNSERTDEQLTFAESARVEVKHRPKNIIRKPKEYVPGKVRIQNIAVNDASNLKNKESSIDVDIGEYFITESTNTEKSIEVKATDRPQENSGYVDSNFDDGILIDTAYAPQHLMPVKNYSQQNISGTIYPFKATNSSIDSTSDRLTEHDKIKSNIFSDSILTTENYITTLSPTDSNRGPVESTTEEMFAHNLNENETYIGSDSNIVYAFAIVPSDDKHESTTMEISDLSTITESPMEEESTINFEMENTEPTTHAGTESTTIMDIEAITLSSLEETDSTPVLKSKNEFPFENLTYSTTEKDPNKQLSTKLNVIETTTLPVSAKVTPAISSTTTSEAAKISSISEITNPPSNGLFRKKEVVVEKLPNLPFNFIENFFSEKEVGKSTKNENKVNSPHVIGRSTISEVHSSHAVVCFSNGKCIIANGIRK